MEAIDIARRMAELNQTEEACQAYTLALHSGGLSPEEELEGAAFILQSGGDYRVAYTWFLSLYNRGLFQEDCLSVMTGAFYEPNIKALKTQYEKNCKSLEKYPYLFRKDFPDFENLPLRFYPFDDDSYLPFNQETGNFGDYWKPSYQVISRNFFKDLENPILAKDVYSQYELEYLYDNVRRSEDIGRENHIYLHYSDWSAFCASLQCLNLRKLLKDKKIVFLIGDEISQYPIDFKERYGIDYSKYPVKPIGIRDVHRLIWHTQLASHNGGDFFNEIFDGHPNLLAGPSYIMDKLMAIIDVHRQAMDSFQDEETAVRTLVETEPRVTRELYRLKDRTDKDILVALFLGKKGYTLNLDHGSRITPAIFFQPHFENINYDLEVNAKKQAVISSEQYSEIQNSPIFRNFKYIKTFTPMRRVTTSHAASVRFAWEQPQCEEGKKERGRVKDMVVDRICNRSFMIDPEDRLYRDSVLVRFEDGKLNPKATFTALAAFLDLPYTESMTYCSLAGKRDPESLRGNDLGFSPAAIYRTYDDYASDDERAFIEYFMRDAYEYYGYDFQYYDGKQVDEEQIRRWIVGFTAINYYMRESLRPMVPKMIRAGKELSGAELAESKKEFLDGIVNESNENRLAIANALQSGLHFVNKNGQPLRMMPKLKLDPALLEQPLYH